MNSVKHALGTFDSLEILKVDLGFLDHVRFCMSSMVSRVNGVVITDVTPVCGYLHMLLITLFLYFLVVVRSIVTIIANIG